MLRESQSCELKREYVEEIKNTVVAFANSNGGRLLIGVADDGAVVGVADADAVQLRAANAIRDAISPDVTLFTEIVVRELAERPVVEITVQRGTARPYYLRGKGPRPQGVYVRQGAASVPASEAAILQMIRETSGDRYEEGLSLCQNLSFEQAAAVFARKEVAFGEAQRRTLHLVREDGAYTNLALLLSDQCPHTIKLAVYEGGQKNIFRDRAELHGSLLRQLEEAYAYIDRFNHLRAEYRQLERVERRDYPEQAVREALLNAVVHRDYGFSAATLINIFDQRLEFVSVGGLVPGITLADLRLGVSVLRNRYLAEVFYRLRLIEAYGTGIMKIADCYRSCPRQPQLEATDNAFRITLPNVNEAAEPSGSAAVLALLERQPLLRRSEVEAALGVSQTQAGVLLRQLCEKGLVVKVGRGRGVRYRRA